MLVHDDWVHQPVSADGVDEGVKLVTLQEREEVGDRMDRQGRRQWHGPHGTPTTALDRGASERERAGPLRSSLRSDPSCSADARLTQPSGRLSEEDQRVIRASSATETRHSCRGSLSGVLSVSLAMLLSICVATLLSIALSSLGSRWIGRQSVDERPEHALEDRPIPRITRAGFGRLTGTDHNVRRL